MNRPNTVSVSKQLATFMHGLSSLHIIVKHKRMQTVPKKINVPWLPLLIWLLTVEAYLSMCLHMLIEVLQRVSSGPELDSGNQPLD